MQLEIYKGLFNKAPEFCCSLCWLVVLIYAWKLSKGNTQMVWLPYTSIFIGYKLLCPSISKAPCLYEDRVPNTVTCFIVEALGRMANVEYIAYYCIHDNINIISEGEHSIYW